MGTSSSGTFHRWIPYVLTTVSGFMLLGFLSVYWIFSTGPEVRQAQQNALNVRRVAIGMDRRQVLRIMGNPQRIEAPLQRTGLTYVYAASSLSSHEIAVVLGPDNVVTAVYRSE
ncbi:hypothetical protein [Hymenobacter glacialis]|uniref:hypothetical protein n=1 Tax=Hymenobacter glacialis TaxID=1908236 RepID=UPI000F772C8F|nr:hypothetical protein [Hymenobacter glacialis]